MVSDLLTIRIKRQNNRSICIPGRALAIAILLLVLFIPALVHPDRVPLPDCYFKSLTGYSCPTCGLTHSFYEFSHFHLKSAFSYHFFGPILYMALLILLCTLIYEAITGRRITASLRPGMTRLILILAAAGWFGYWIIRVVHELQA